MKIFVSGASGNVGRAIIRTARDTKDFKIIGGWSLESGLDLGTLAGGEPLGVLSSDNLEGALDAAKPDVVIDFTVTPVLKKSLEMYAAKNLNVFIGKTGLTEDDFAPYKKLVAEKGLKWAAIANYGIGLSFVGDFVKKVREFYPYVAITDRHTAKMANAPSGTSAALAKSFEGKNGPVESKESYASVLGAEIAGIRVTSQRLPYPGPYSEHEITLGRTDEIISIKIQDYSSDIYMDGLFMTVQKLPALPPGTFITDLSEILAK